MARSMVTRYGMSDLIGLMAIGQQDQEIFLGRELVQRREVSEHTASRVDREIKRVLDEAHERAREVLTEHKDLLEDFAQALLERETLDAAEIKLLNAGEELPTLVPLEEKGDDGDTEEEGTPSQSAEDGAEPEAAVAVPPIDEGSGDDQAASREVRTPAVRLGSQDPETGASG